jgi:hypothetical protein
MAAPAMTEAAKRAPLRVFFSIIADGPGRFRDKVTA